MTCSDVADLLQVLVLQYGRYWNPFVISFLRTSSYSVTSCLSSKKKER